jgi:hypothetical protein
MKDVTYFERAIRELQEAADNSRRVSDPEAALCHMTHSAWAVRRPDAGKRADAADATARTVLDEADGAARGIWVP